jgi:hypothetical protein
MAAVLLEQTDIGECAAGIHTDPPRHLVRPGRLPMRRR